MCTDNDLTILRVATEGVFFQDELVSWSPVEAKRRLVCDLF